jgi:hypothetical protein
VKIIKITRGSESKYAGVQLGIKEGEVMKDLIYKHGFFVRKETYDFQGSCRNKNN